MKTAEKQHKLIFAIAASAALAGAVAAPVNAASGAGVSTSRNLSYADLADLAIPAKLVVKAQIRKQAVLAPEQSPQLRPGWVRLYVEAQTQALIAGNAPIGESLKYLVDVPLDSKGKVPRLKKQDVILFALAVPGRPDELQLVDTDAQLPADSATEARVRALLAELAAPDAPPKVTGVRDALSVAGNLAGESETQIFLDTSGDASATVNVIRRPGMAPQWGVSWTELVDQAAKPPKHDTLEWYRLACFLPDSLPQDAILSHDGTSRFRAADDYRLVLQELGPCPRNRRQP
jgi:hypothetical protein